MPRAWAATLGRDLLSEASSSGNPAPGPPIQLERGECPLGDTRHQAPLLLLRAKIDQRLRRMEIRRPDDAGRGARLADLAHTGEVCGVAEPRAAISLGHKDRIEAERVDRVDIVP